MMAHITGIEVVTFDCYGTLIDWERGALEVMESLLRATTTPTKLSARELFERWEEIQFEYIQEPYEPYQEILYDSLLDTLESFDIPYRDGDGDRLANAIVHWRPFPEVPGALRRLKTKYKLGIISNIDDDILAQTTRHLGVQMDMLMTAERAGYYKPDPEPFRRALEELQVPPDRILHAAFGYKYDLGPASRLGLRTAFVNRGGIELPEGVEPSTTVKSLTELADRLGV